ncbi:hypothetical protein ACFFX0_19540 [Citricoccus parietis]|uniref:Uncharacterized protein n=1 Tax=Citricoccus parietis TaxID=592307 RepID=A0ABV5G2W3_9MICC
MGMAPTRMGVRSSEPLPASVPADVASSPPDPPDGEPEPQAASPRVRVRIPTPAVSDRRRPRCERGRLGRRVSGGVCDGVSAGGVIEAPYDANHTRSNDRSACQA